MSGEARPAPASLVPEVRPGSALVPQVGTVRQVVPETPQIVSIVVDLVDVPAFAAGQVGQLGVFGVGEATFVISSPPSQRDALQFSVMRAGEVTSAIHNLSPGESVGVRAPLGHGFPIDQYEGKNVIIAAGGIGMAPLRPLLLTMLERRDRFAGIKLIYGARTPDDLCYAADRALWAARDDLDYIETIDAPVEGWKGRVGFVPTVLEEESPDPENAVAITCGPPIMIRFVLQGLEKHGFAPDQIVTTLEKRMKCGIGLCGRCNIGTQYVCTDGPVFTLAQLRELPDEL